MHGGERVLLNGEMLLVASLYSKNIINHTFLLILDSMIFAYQRFGSIKHLLQRDMESTAFAIITTGFMARNFLNVLSRKYCCQESQTDPFVFAGPMRIGHEDGTEWTKKF